MESSSLAIDVTTIPSSGTTIQSGQAVAKFLVLLGFHIQPFCFQFGFSTKADVGLDATLRAIHFNLIQPELRLFSMFSKPKPGPAPRPALSAGLDLG